MLRVESVCLTPPPPPAAARVGRLLCHQGRGGFAQPCGCVFTRGAALDFLGRPGSCARVCFWGGGRRVTVATARSRVPAVCGVHPCASCRGRACVCGALTVRHSAPPCRVLREHTLRRRDSRAATQPRPPLVAPPPLPLHSTACWAAHPHSHPRRHCKNVFGH